MLKRKQTCPAFISNSLSDTFFFCGEESITLNHSSYMSPLPAFQGTEGKATHRILPSSKLILQYIH